MALVKGTLPGLSNGIICWVFWLHIIYLFQWAYFSQFFNPLASTISQKNSGISALLSMDHHTFQISRSYSRSEFKPFPGHLVRCYALYTETAPKSINSCLSSLMFQPPWWCAFRICSHVKYSYSLSWLICVPLLIYRFFPLSSDLTCSQVTMLWYNPAHRPDSQERRYMQLLERTAIAL